MKRSTSGVLVIVSAIIWGGIILGCSFRLRGTDCYQEISTILSMGFILHLLLVWAPLFIIKGRKKE